MVHRTGKQLVVADFFWLQTDEPWPVLSGGGIQQVGGAWFSMSLPWEGGVWGEVRRVMTNMPHLSPVLPHMFVISFFLSP